jgi:acyl-CoA thioesterase-1
MAFKRLLVAAFVLAAGLSASVASAIAEPARIVAFGDSLMAGYQLDAGQSFPEKLEAALRGKGHDVVIANASVSGDTTSGGLARLDWSVPDDTDLVILELGANDMLRGVAPELTEKNLVAMIERLQQRDIGVLLAGMLAAPNLGQDYADRFNTIYPRLAETYDLPLYPFFLDGVAAQAGLLLGDGMHPNPDGVDEMVERFLPAIEPLLGANPGG